MDAPATPSAAAPARPAPVSAERRLVVVDALRGLALCGILLVNIQVFSGPARLYQTVGEGGWTGADAVAFFLVTALVEGKFISSFAFLFGLGIALQTTRAERRGGASGGFLARRLAVLAGFGALHAVLLWSGDVLLLYALLGVALVLLRHRSPRALLAWAAGLYGAAVALLALALGLTLLGDALGAAELDAGAGLRELADGAVRAYRSGDYGAMTAQRLRELALTYAGLPFVGPWTLATMVLGMAAGRARLAERLDSPLVRRVARAGLAVGLPLSVLAAAGIAADPSGTDLAGFGGEALLLTAAPVLALGYLASGARLLSRSAEAPATRRLAAMGRMALTNYLLQTVLCTAVFSGLRWYGRVSLVTALGVAAAVLAAELAWSPWYLARHAQGPMEWLWRRLSYGSGRRPSRVRSDPQSLLTR